MEIHPEHCRHEITFDFRGNHFNYCVTCGSLLTSVEQIAKAAKGAILQATGRKCNIEIQMVRKRMGGWVNHATAGLKPLYIIYPTGNAPLALDVIDTKVQRRFMCIECGTSEVLMLRVPLTNGHEVHAMQRSSKARIVRSDRLMRYDPLCSNCADAKYTITKAYCSHCEDNFNPAPGPFRETLEERVDQESKWTLDTRSGFEGPFLAICPPCTRTMASEVSAEAI